METVLTVLLALFLHGGGDWGYSRIVETLGGGGKMGLAYKAEDTSLRRFVALKIHGYRFVMEEALPRGCWKHALKTGQEHCTQRRSGVH